MNQIDIIGITAGILLIISYIPQFIIIIKDKQTNNASLISYCILLASQVLSVVYALLNRNYQSIIFNITAGCITGLIILCCIYFKIRS